MVKNLLAYKLLVYHLAWTKFPKHRAHFAPTFQILSTDQKQAISWNPTRWPVYRIPINYTPLGGSPYGAYQADLHTPLLYQQGTSDQLPTTPTITQWMHSVDRIWTAVSKWPTWPWLRYLYARLKHQPSTTNTNIQVLSGLSQLFSGL